MSAIAAIRTAVLALLDDATNVRYSNTLVDQAIRQALAEYNQARPLEEVYNVDGANTYRIEMPADFAPISITKVELHDTSANPQQEVMFTFYYVDLGWYIQTQEILVKSTQSLDVFYSKAHTIDGLDSGAGTTIPIEDEPIFELGAAGYASLIRAVSRSETVNLQPQVYASLMKLAEERLSQFRAQIKRSSGPGFANLPANDAPQHYDAPEIF